MPATYRSVASHLEERGVYRGSELVKEFPVQCDMRAAYRENNKRKTKNGTDHMNTFSSLLAETKRYLRHENVAEL
jgi:hypothetical protein